MSFERVMFSFESAKLNNLQRNTEQVCPNRTRDYLC